MASTRQKVIGASSSIIIFVTLIGILSYIQDKNLNLTSYLQPIITNVQVQHNNISKSELKKINTGISIQGAHDKLTRYTDLYTQNAKSNYKQPSPACYPHFQSLTSINEWTFTNKTMFNRLYFYHARKAGGTSLATYFSTVARHYGLEFAQSEWTEAEEPGSVPGTFYVAHLREPVDRSISHFKYQGRWDCSDLSKMRRRDDTAFIPTVETANKITTWNQTSGHLPQECTTKTSGIHFKLGICAVNCYIQWFSGLSCPQFNTTTIQQYEVAKTMLLRYNFIVVLEKLKDAQYVTAVEKMFGVPGITQRGSAYCERTSHKANEMIPLKIEDDTLQRLTHLNRVDIGLYKELTDCLDDDRGDHKYNFPRMDEDGLENRFDTNTSIQVKYYNLIEWKKEKRLNKTRAKALEDQVDASVEAAEAEITGELFGQQSDEDDDASQNKKMIVSRPDDPTLNKKKLKRNKYKRANDASQNKTKERRERK